MHSQGKRLHPFWTRVMVNVQETGLAWLCEDGTNSKYVFNINNFTSSSLSSKVG